LVAFANTRAVREDKWLHDIGVVPRSHDAARVNTDLSSLAVLAGDNDSDDEENKGKPALFDELDGMWAWRVPHTNLR